MTGRRRHLLAVAAVAATVLAACGGGDTGADFVGYRREPLPDVGDIALPDATADDAPFALEAPPDGLLLVYFGYTNCPDYCPTTMSDVKLALNRLDDPERVEVAMVTVDPDRDFAVDPERCASGRVLACYITSFVDDAHALGTEDPDALARAAAPFGVGYKVYHGDAGETLVDHTTSLYAVDDQGRLVLTWQFGVSVDDLTADINRLLDEDLA